MASRRSAARLVRLRLEALVWITRPHSVFSYVPIALAAWSLGNDGPQGGDLGEVVLLVLALMVMQAAMFVLNDVFDAPNDSITAPYMPIPSGIVSRQAATALVIVLAITVIVLILSIAPTRTTLVLVAILVPAALVTFKLYSITKGFWFSPLLEISTFTSAAVLAWLLAGASQPEGFAIVFAIAAIHGVEANVRSQLRDLEGDPRAGNLTLVARLGPKKAVWLLASIRVFEVALAGVLWMFYGPPIGAIWLVAPIVLLLVALARSRVLFGAAPTRLDQTSRLSWWSYGAFCVEVAVLGALHPAGAGLVAAFMVAWYRGVRARYYQRVAGGELATDIAETASGSV